MTQHQTWLVSVFLASALCAGARANTGAAIAAMPEIPLHTWVIPSPHSPESYFTNLKNGGSYESPFVARFGLSMRGLVPAGQVAGRAGHHHLLINQPLPLDFAKPLPFTDRYLHFGKGQMEAVVNLPPGTYDMRMLLADQAHIPYFIFSKPMNITVTKQNKDVSPESLKGERRVEILSPTDRETIRPPFRLQMHASGYGISHAAVQVPETGHFRLTLERPGRKPEVLTLNAGQTEVWLNPPVGDYTAQLELVSNTPAGSVMTKGKPVAFAVTMN
ncbi:MAG: DUF4399 domain-containing protein [Polaromonas sp.]|nr:DUF4399 domain-containing protein [Polaromonas sp.]